MTYAGVLERGFARRGRSLVSDIFGVNGFNGMGAALADLVEHSK
jgi:hypothetical protein